MFNMIPIHVFRYTSNNSKHLIVSTPIFELRIKRSAYHRLYHILYKEPNDDVYESLGEAKTTEDCYNWIRGVFEIDKQINYEDAIEDIEIIKIDDIVTISEDQYSLRLISIVIWACAIGYFMQQFITSSLTNLLAAMAIVMLWLLKDTLMVN